MIVIRQARMSDINCLMDISTATGSGMSSMPTNLGKWQSKLQASEECFEKAVSEPSGETYFMVMEDLETGKLVGTTAIYAGVGLDQPFYSYKVSTLISISRELEKKNQMEVLHLVNDFTGSTEIGSLYLDPDYRINGNGRFLSRCRFLMLADFPERFGETIIAEMRGWQDGEGHSPFWEQLGRKFFGLGFENADFMSAVKGNQFITDLMPRHPIYADLLPTEARDAIGVAHPASKPALKLLEKEGFRKSGYVDIFDGGPTVQCQIRNIETVKNCQRAEVQKLDDDLNTNKSKPFMISNCNLNNYRFVRGGVVQLDKGSVALDRKTADALQVKEGQIVSFAA